MMKYMKWLTVWMVLMVVGMVQAASLRALDSRERLAWGSATHMIEVTYEDFTETTDNTAETLTFNVAAKEGVEFVAMQLVSAFDTASTNTASLAVTAGDGTDADLYLTSTELASDGTEVWLKFGALNSGTIAVTPLTTSLEADPVLTLAKDGANVTNVTVATTSYTVSTNATAVFTAGELGRKVYTSADTVDLAFTPHAEEATSDFTSGKVRFYFRIF